MTRRFGMGCLLSLCVGWLVLSGGSPVSAQMGPGMMEGRGMMGQGQTSGMPMQQMSEVIKHMADRLAAGQGLDTDKAERLRRLAEQLIAVTGRMPGGMEGDMMGQGSEEMREVSRILSQMSTLLQGQ